MNKKAFTLTELLVMMVVLGILSAITIPNIMGIIKNNKNLAYIDDAKNMYDATRIKEAKKKIDKVGSIATGNCLLIQLEYLDSNEDFTKGPYGGDYDKFESFVVILNEGNTTDSTTGSKVSNFKYYIRLVEHTDGKLTGIRMSEYSKLRDPNETMVVDGIDQLELNKSSDDAYYITNKVKRLIPKCSYVSVYSE